MYQHRLIVVAIVLLAVLTAAPGAVAQTGSELIRALDDLADIRSDDSTTGEVQSLVLTHKDFRLTLDSGKLAFLRPIVLGQDSLVTGAYFSGKAYLEFATDIPMEQEQLVRFFRSPAYVDSAVSVLLFFNGPYRSQIEAALQPLSDDDPELNQRPLKQYLKTMTHNDERYFQHRILRNALDPQEQPFLMACATRDKFRTVAYLFDPFSREEVHFLLRYEALGGYDFFETVCRYSVFNDTTYARLNGECKDRLAAVHYDSKAEIDSRGKMTADATVDFVCLRDMPRLLPLDLFYELRVDSVLTANGTPLAFRRFDSWRHKSGELFVALEDSLVPGDTLQLRFFYHGEVANKDYGYYVVHCGAEWYPRCLTSSLATFDMTFRTPDDYQFVATGEEVSREEVDGDLVTSWTIDTPCHNAAFNIGVLEKREVSRGEAPEIDLYTIPLVGKDRSAPGSVASDVLLSSRLFAMYFGPCTQDRLVATELIGLHGEAFPGFIHLGMVTFIKGNDPYGYHGQFRSHEVAHQWWGIDVDHETYHDTWLTEGLAEFSSLLYLQSTSDLATYVKRVKEYGVAIRDAHHYIFRDDQECGPVTMGVRTASSRTEDDYSLIIYKKAAYVFHMLRYLLMDFEGFNEDRFFAMLRSWHEENIGREINTRQFQEHVEKHVGIDMDWFFRQWVYGNDIPKYTFRYEVQPGSNNDYEAVCSIEQEGVPEEFMMYVPLDIELEGDRHAYMRVLVDAPLVEFVLPMRNVPKSIRLNPFEAVLADVDD